MSGGPVIGATLDPKFLASIGKVQEAAQAARVVVKQLDTEMKQTIASGDKVDVVKAKQYQTAQAQARQYQAMAKTVKDTARQTDRMAVTLKTMFGGELAKKFIRGERINFSDVSRTAFSLGPQIERMFGERVAASIPIFGELIHGGTEILNLINKDREERKMMGRAYGAGGMSEAEWTIANTFGGAQKIENVKKLASGIGALSASEVTNIVDSLKASEASKMRDNIAAAAAAGGAAPLMPAIIDALPQLSAERLFNLIRKGTEDFTAFYNKPPNPEQSARIMRNAVIGLGLNDDITQKLLEKVEAKVQKNEQEKPNALHAAAQDAIDERYKVLSDYNAKLHRPYSPDALGVRTEDKDVPPQSNGVGILGRMDRSGPGISVIKQYDKRVLELMRFTSERLREHKPD